MESTVSLFALLGVMGVVISCYQGLSARVRTIERKLDLLMRHEGVDWLQRGPLPDRVKELANDPARKIEAIKAYRWDTGASLAEAKEAVETYMNSK